MRLATRRDGSRDGELVLVARDRSRLASARAIAPNLQSALDVWDQVLPELTRLEAELEAGIRGEPLDLGQLQAPLPRAYALHDHPVDFAERSEAMRRLGATSRMLAVPYDRRGRVSASGPGEIETLRRRYREAEAAVALRDSFTTRRRRWTAGFDLAYAEGAYGATAAGALTLPRSEG